MEAGDVVTYGLALLVVGVVGATIKFLTWFNTKWEGTETKILAQLGDFRQDVQKALSQERKTNAATEAEFRERFEALMKQLSSHERHVAETYMTKAGAMGAIKEMMEELRRVRGLIEQQRPAGISSSEMEAMLARVLADVLKHREGGK